MSDTNYSDLINEFGSKGTANNKVVTPYADLINEFGSGEVAADHPPIPQTKPGSLFVRQGDTSVKIPPNYVPAAAPMNGIQEYRDKNLLETGPAVKETPVTPIDKLPIVRQTIDAARSGNQLAASGLEDISKGMTATGVGKVGLGMFQSVASPFTGTLKEGVDLLNPFGGELGDRAEAVVTSGLPVAKLGKVAVATMPSTRALSTLVENIGPENIPSVISKLQSNPRLTLADVDPNVQIITQGLAAKPGQPRNILDKFVQGRKDQSGAVTNIYDESMGIPVNVKDKIDSLKSSLQATGKEINPIVKGTGPVDISPVVASINQKLQPGVNSIISAGEPLPLGDIEKTLEKVKGFMTDEKSFRTDPQSLHNFQSALRAKADDLLSSTSGQDRQLGRALMDVRNQVVDAIDKASPQIQQADGSFIGSYRPALSKYRDQYSINDAFTKGQLVTKNRLGNLEDDPSYWEDWISKATPQELEAAKEGARLAVAQQMGSVQNAARKGMTIPDVEFNKEKLQLLFGKKEVDQMAKELNDEKSIADTNSKLFQGSQTAMRQLGAEATAVRPDYEPKFTKTILPIALEAGTQYLSGGSIPALGLTAGLAYPFARSKITKIGQNLDRSTNVEIANLASATGEARDNLIKALQGHVPQAKLSMKQRLQLALPVQKP